MDNKENGTPDEDEEGIALQLRFADGTLTTVWLTPERADAFAQGEQAVTMWPERPMALSAGDDGELREGYTDVSLRNVPPPEPEGA
jgi:hypothetical protein